MEDVDSSVNEAFDLVGNLSRTVKAQSAAFCQALGAVEAPPIVASYGLYGGRTTANEVLLVVNERPPMRRELREVSVFHRVLHHAASGAVNEVRHILDRLATLQPA